MSDDVVLVDGDDRPIGRAAKLEAHARNLRHRAISVLIFDSEGRMLLQRRALEKYHSPGLWSNACCSHPRPGEPTAEAAVRRLEEELGFACPLTFVDRVAYEAPVGNGLHENEVVHVFVGQYDGTIAPDGAEVAAFDWRPVEEIRADLKQRAGHYTAWFRLYAAAPWFEAPATIR